MMSFRLAEVYKWWLAEVYKLWHLGLQKYTNGGI